MQTVVTQSVTSVEGANTLTFTLFLTVALIFGYFVGRWAYPGEIGLISQSGKQDRKDHWANKQKNKRKASEKKARNAQIIEQLKKEAKDRKASKASSKKYLDSQSGRQGGFSRFLRCVLMFGITGLSSYIMNKSLFAVFYEFFDKNGVESIAFLWRFSDIIRSSFSNTVVSLENYVEETKKKLNILTSTLKIPSLDPLFDSLSSVMKNLKYIRTSKILVQLFDIINIIVTLGWLGHFDLNIKGVSLFKSESLRRQVTFMDLIEAIGKFSQTFLGCFIVFMGSGDLSCFFADAKRSMYDDKFTMLLSQKLLMETGRLEIEAHEYDRILCEMIQTTLDLLDSVKDGERAYYASRLKDLRSLSVARVLMSKDYIRVAPYAVLLFGKSSVGKSAVANALMRWLLKVNNFDFSPRSVITLNEFDKFQSEYRAFHAGVIFDDLCNGKVDTTEGNPLMKIIQFINNATMSALNPNVELKGNVPIQPKVVFGTTNVKDLKASAYTNEPLSIARRFNVTVTVEVLPQYCKNGTEMLDPSKIEQADDDRFPHFGMYTCERAIPRPGSIDDKAVAYQIIEHNGKKLERVSIDTMMEFLIEDSRAHFEQQSRFVENQRKMENIDLNEDGMPVEFDSQMFSGFAEITDFIVEKEEIIMSWLEERLEALLYTKFGQVFLTYWFRTSLISSLMYVGYFLLAGLFVAFGFEYFGTRTLFLYFVFCVVSLSLSIFWFCFKRWQLIIRLTTLPRPSKFINDLSYMRKMQLLSAFGGMTTLSIIVNIIRKIREVPTSQGSTPTFVKSEKPDLAPWWGSENRREREAKYVVPVDVPQSTKTMTNCQLTVSMRKRQWLLHIGEEGESLFCNAVTVKSSILIIPNHVVPKTSIKARLTKEGAHPKHVYIFPESCYRIPDTDYALWYLPEMGTQKDITSYFSDEIDRGKKALATMIYNDSGKVKDFPEMLITRSYNRTSKGGSFESWTYSFPGRTFNGLCMATMIAENNKGVSFIPGFHLAGKDSFGCAGALSRQQLIDGIVALNKRPTVLASHSAMPYPAEVAGIQIPLTAPHDKCVSNELPTDAKCKIFGAHPFPRGSPSSKVVTSMISTAVSKIMKLPKMHDKPMDMSSRRHKEVDIVDKVDTAYRFQGDSLDKAVIDFQSTIIEGMKPDMYAALGILPLDANLAGIDGVQGVNAMAFTTSAGFPFRGSKEQFVELSDRFVEGISCPRDVDPIIIEEMTRMEDALARGECINTVYKGALKDEGTKVGKAKVRVFAGCNMPFTLLVRKYFLSVSSLMQTNKKLFESAVAINPMSPEWTDLMKHIYRFGDDRVIAGDYKSFDRRMSPRFMLAAFKILINVCEKSGQYDSRDLMVMQGVATEITNPTYDYFGTLIQFFGSNPSGHPLTVVINSLVNSLYMRYCYFEIAKTERWWKVPRFNEVVSLMTYGDDNIMSVKKGYDAYNHTRVAEVLDAAGITYTMADKEAESVPFIKGEEAGFLKRDAIWDPELELFRACLDESSISKSLHVHIKSDAITEQQHSAEAIIGAADEYFEYGRETYESRRDDLHKVAEETGIAGLVGEIMTYDDQMRRFCERNAWPLPSGY